MDNDQIADDGQLDDIPICNDITNDIPICNDISNDIPICLLLR